MMNIRDVLIGFLVGLLAYFIFSKFVSPKISGFVQTTFDPTLTVEQARKQADDMIKQLIDDLNSKAQAFKTPEENVKAMEEMHDNVNEINKAFMKWTVTKPSAAPVA
jgi:gas vesicle protein